MSVPVVLRKAPAPGAAAAPPPAASSGTPREEEGPETGLPGLQVMLTGDVHRLQGAEGPAAVG